MASSQPPAELDEALAMARANVSYYRQQRANHDYVWDYDAFLHHADHLAATLERLLTLIDPGKENDDNGGHHG